MSVLPSLMPQGALVAKHFSFQKLIRGLYENRASPLMLTFGEVLPVLVTYHSLLILCPTLCPLEIRAMMGICQFKMPALAKSVVSQFRKVNNRT
jgi:hypothetical protein